MRIDGIQLAEGSSLANATIASGTSFPSLPSIGELFFRSDTGKLHFYNNTSWIELVGRIEGDDGSVLNGQPGSYYLDLQNATGVLSIDHGGTGVATLELLRAAVGFDGDLEAISNLSGTTGILRKTAANTWVLDTTEFISGNQNITVTGDVTGSGTTALNLSLQTTGTAGTYKSVTTDSKGRVTAGTNPTTLAGYGITDALKNTDSTFTGTLTMHGDILPSTNITYNLGSPEKMWKDIYVGPGSIYMNGKKILEEVASTIVFTSDDNQNVRIETSGTGNLELQSSASAAIQVKGTLSISSGKRIVDSAGIQVEFADNIEMGGNRITGLAVPSAATDAASKAYVDGATSSDLTIVRTTGNQSIAGQKTFTGAVVISGDLTISGTTTTVNSQTVLLADNILELNSDFTSGMPSEDSGIQIRRGDLGTVKLIWDEANDRFTLVSGAGDYLPLWTSNTITAGSFIGPLTGNASSATVLATSRTINGAAFNGSANISFTTDAVAEGSTNLYFTNARASAAAPVQSFNTRTGAVSLTSGDVTGALGFSPVQSFNTRGGVVTLTSGDVTTALGFTPANITGQVFSGNITTPILTTDAVYLKRSATLTNGISFYGAASGSNNSWMMYMSPGGTANSGPYSNLTAPSGTYVTNWALRSFIENASGYGWTWEAGTGTTTTPSVIAELSSVSGNFKTTGGVFATSFTGAGTGLTGTASSLTVGSATSTPLLASLANNTWTASQLPTEFSMGAQLSFVSQEVGGFPSYGTVMTMRTYSGSGGGVLQLYTPYSPAYGGTGLMFRSGIYESNTWSSWKTIIDSSSIGTQTVAAATTATKFISTRANYDGVTDSSVTGQLRWSNFGNNHTIFDASKTLGPTGAAITSNTNPDNAWTATYPTLMGYNGADTYGVRVDRSRFAENLITGASVPNPSIINYTEAVYAPAAGTAFTVNLTNGTIQKFTTSGNITITLPSNIGGKSFTIIVAYGGAHTVTFTGGSTLKWSGGSVPTPTSVSGKFDIYVFMQDGSNTYGQDGGRNF